MLELDDLYQEIVIDHSNRPRNFRKPEGVTSTAEGSNPLCGDQITLHLVVDNGTIQDIGFEGHGCAISKASASMLTENVKGMSEEKATQTFQAFRDMVTRKPGEKYDSELLGDLEILKGVSSYPVRIKCATLSWHTLNAALTEPSTAITTE